ncbi:hypothetical protein CRENBAI_012029, partial [Crenichthys baileyi]
MGYPSNVGPISSPPHSLPVVGVSAHRWTRGSWYLGLGTLVCAGSFPVAACRGLDSWALSGLCLGSDMSWGLWVHGWICPGCSRLPAGLWARRCSALGVLHCGCWVVPLLLSGRVAVVLVEVFLGFLCSHGPLDVYASDLLSLVSDSCVDMSPHHSGSPQTTTSPFTVSTEQSSFRPGEDVKVSLQAPASSPFMGFLLEAREPGGQSAVGSFVVSSGSARLLSCFQRPNTAVSHTSASIKTNIQVTWKPDSAGNIKSVQFQASFVKSYKTFWVGLKSPVLSLMNDDHTDSSSTSLPSSNSISSAGCGASKVCISQPADCDPASSSQCYFMSARLLSPGGPAVRYEITGTADGYVAFGFSDDQTMGNDDIYICGIDSTGLVEVQHAFSTGRTAPQVQPLGNVSDVRALVQNGVLSCSFTSKNPISTQRSSGFSSMFYLLFAYGARSNGITQMHTDTFISSQRINISAPDVVQTDEKVHIIQAH